VKRTSAPLTHDSGRTEPLNGSGECQHRQRMREGASERSEAKDDDAKLKDPSKADHLADGSHRKKRNDDGELIGVHHPHRVRGGSVEVRSDRRKSHVCDRAVEYGKRERKPDGGGGPVTLGSRKTVWLRRHLRQGSPHSRVQYRDSLA
jgi:hypothetical protein